MAASPQPTKPPAAPEPAPSVGSVDDPLRAKPGMTAAEVTNASPAHLLVPDPLPPLSRPIFEAPRMGAVSPPILLHPAQDHPVMEAAVEGLRLKLGELREFLKGFAHDPGGELGSLVDYLRVALGVARADPIRDADRRTEDAHVAARRRAEDISSGGTVSSERLARRQEEDAGLATYRRIQDT